MAPVQIVADPRAGEAITDIVSEDHVGPSTGSHDAFSGFMELLSGSAKERPIAMLGGYFDESGTHDGAKVLVVAGYIAPPSAWKAVQRTWATVLTKAGIDPTVTPFHMTDFVARRAPFDWGEQKRNAVIRNLIKTITEHAAVGIAVGVAVDDYNDLAEQVGEPFSAYTFCLTRCVLRAGQWARSDGRDDRIAYVFESGAGYDDEINHQKLQILSRRSWRETYALYSLTLADKRDALPLQAADIGVWEARRYCLANILGDSHGLRKSLEALLVGLPHLSAYYDRRELIRYVNHIREKRGEPPFVPPQKQSE